MYYRLLKDTPDANAGDVFKYNHMTHLYESITNDNICYSIKSVENQPDWFEEVQMIFVREKNAEKLEEIDRLADENSIIGDAIGVRVA